MALAGCLTDPVKFDILEQLSRELISSMIHGVAKAVI